jgi:hypothetical protein
MARPQALIDNAYQRKPMKARWRGALAMAGMILFIGAGLWRIIVRLTALMPQ